MSKPIITTLVIGTDYKKGLQRCLASKRSYTEKHGYTYIEGGEQYWDRTKPISWSKIPFLLEVCANSPEGALIWQSDADVLITNSEKRVEDVIFPLLPEGKDMLMTHDACGHINAGNILYRNTEWTRDFLKRVGEQTQFTYHIWWENAAIINLINTNMMDASKIEVTKNHKAFNAYLRGVPGQPLWEQGDLLVHFAGVYNPKDISELTEKILAGETPRLSM